MSAAATGRTDSDLLTAAFSAIMGLPLRTNVPDSDQVERVSVFDHHKTTYAYGRVGNERTASTTNNRWLLFVKTLNGGVIECDVEPNAKIEEIKRRIYELSNVSPDQQRLIFNGKQLEDGKIMSEYYITAESTLHLVARINASKPVILDPASLDSMHNYDFTDINDGSQKFTRGGERYVRPCGWKRFALNVSNKYENLLWIGSNNGVGEWPVSYHGTGDCENKTIAQDGYPLTKGQQFSFPRGVYSTPDVSLAERYAKRFTYNNEQYQVIFQNRVNPANINKFQATVAGTGDYWVSPSDADVRPYGICIRKV